MPFVSIVTTTFNRPEYLRQALHSAITQTFADFELLVCDDGGLAETRRICESFHDARIRHIVNPVRLGIAMNSLAGVERAQSDCITFLNDDDRWTAGFLAQCARPLLDDAETVLSFSDHWLIDAHGDRLIAATEANTRAYGREGLNAGAIENPRCLMARLSIPLAMAAVFRRSKVDWSRYSRRVEGAYDSYIAYSLLCGAGKVLYVPERLTEYRAHGGGASAEFHRQTTEGLAYVHELMLCDPAYRPFAREIRRTYRGLEKHLVKLSLAERDLPAAAVHGARLLRHGLV